MNSPKAQTRIFVDLDVSTDPEGTVRAAVTLAAALRAELHGLFVVDDDSLLDFAGLPFSVAIDPDRGTLAEVSPTIMQSAILRREKTSRRLLESQAVRLQLSWKFYRERGHIAEQLRSAVTPGDYVVMPGPARMEGVAGLLRKLSALPNTTSGVLLSSQKREPAANSPVIVLLADPVSATRAVQLGVSVSAVLQAPLVFFVIAEDANSIHEFVAHLEDQTVEGSVYTVHTFVPGSLDVLASAFGLLAPRFVIASRDITAETPKEDIARLIRAAKAPVCLLHSPGMSVVNAAPHLD